MRIGPISLHSYAASLLRVPARSSWLLHRRELCLLHVLQRGQGAGVEGMAGVVALAADVRVELGWGHDHSDRWWRSDRAGVGRDHDAVALVLGALGSRGDSLAPAGVQAQGV
jgi:hypothetical protein